MSLFFAPTVLSGCFWGIRCDCDKEPKTYYDVVGIEVAYPLSPRGFNLNQAYKFDSLQIGVKHTLNYVTTLPPKVLGGASLLATKPCDCWDNYGAKGAKEKVKSISIVSQSNYLTSLSAGTDLSSIISIVTNYEHNFGTTIYYANATNKQKLQNFLSTFPFAPTSFNLLFDLPPTSSKKHIFTIRYELDNGEVYTYTTPEITFQ